MSDVLFRALLDERETAKLLGVTVGTLQVWRSTRRVPLPYIKVGGAVRYRPEHIEAYLESRTHASIEPRAFVTQGAKRKEHRAALKRAASALQAGSQRVKPKTKRRRS
jgi:predicted DNA-binding transcriptional regulator AlpA